MNETETECADAAYFENQSVIQVHNNKLSKLKVIVQIQNSMIAPFDEVKEAVRKYEEKLKGKGDEDRDKYIQTEHSLSMGVIMQKNRKISQEHKIHKLDVIKARKLRLRISQTFEYQLSSQKLQNNSTIAEKKTNKNLASFRLRNSSNFQRTKSIGAVSNFSNKSSLMASRRSVSSLRNSNISQLRQKQSDQAGGMINLFDKFSNHQLIEIEQNQDYYLTKQILKKLFRRYMVKKRFNCKDYTYDNFILKNRRQYTNNDFEQFDKEQAKSYILNTLGVIKKRRQSMNSDHLLTSPLDFNKSKNTIRSQPKIPIRHRSLTLLNEFKSKQLERAKEVQQKYRQKINQNRIDNTYYKGIVDLNRSNLQKSKKKSITERNASHLQKSVQMRNRLNMIHQSYGKYVEIAQNMREQFIKSLMSRKLKIDRG